MPTAPNAWRQARIVSSDGVQESKPFTGWNGGGFPIGGHFTIWTGQFTGMPRQAVDVAAADSDRAAAHPKRLVRAEAGWRPVAAARAARISAVALCESAGCRVRDGTSSACGDPVCALSAAA